MFTYLVLNLITEKTGYGIGIEILLYTQLRIGMDSA